MKDELFPFQDKALKDLRIKSAYALDSYQKTHANQVISFTAPTGSGKTIIMTSLIESVLFGDENFPPMQDSIFVWLSDSPQLNEQSKTKIDTKADKIKLNQCVMITDDSFDQEVLDDGIIYFLNTQKLGKTANLTKHGDNRQYTIWETLANTCNEKSDRLYVIIDEAHRGMQGKNASMATTIMQKFLKGSKEDGLEAMPFVIGMSATPQRFNNLAEGIASTTQRVIVTPDEVRSSGLLKDRIILSYPEDNLSNKDMAVLQAATDEWKNKWDHWYQYCQEQHYAHVYPIFIIQVENGNDDVVSKTNLDDCLKKIEERIGKKFQEGEVVHAFGDITTKIVMNGLNVPYVEPSAISDNRNIRVVFFKESLSTGWDCPRAETLMSFRHAHDATYIAQLLGRMIRTPMQSRVQVDETLNDVNLFLPYFEKETVKSIVDELQNSEGGEIPVDVYGESLAHKEHATLTVRPRITKQYKPRAKEEVSGQESLSNSSGATLQDKGFDDYEPTGINQDYDESHSILDETSLNFDQTDSGYDYGSVKIINREEIEKFINDSGLLSNTVRSVKITDYLRSMYSFVRLLKDSLIDINCRDDVFDDIVKMVRKYVERLKESGKYDELSKNIKEFQLESKVFDVFGEKLPQTIEHYFMSAADSDIERQFDRAEAKLGNEGIGNAYGLLYYDENDPNSYKIDIILFAADDECFEKLMSYAKDKFHELNDKYRRKFAGSGDKLERRYNSIVANGDIVSEHNFKLPDRINVSLEDDGKKYSDHLFVDDFGFAHFNLNSWEEGVLEEERKRDDFVCWIRNPSKGSWPLCIAYEMDDTMKGTYPDFIIVRKDASGYIIDILEPHDPTRTDNVFKAKGYAKYARKNHGIGRIELIRKGTGALNKDKFVRLDMGKSAIQEKVLKAHTNEELNHIFDTDGFVAS